VNVAKVFFFAPSGHDLCEYSVLLKFPQAVLSFVSGQQIKTDAVHGFTALQFSSSSSGVVEVKWAAV